MPMSCRSLANPDQDSGGPNLFNGCSVNEFKRKGLGLKEWLRGLEAPVPQTKRHQQRWMKNKP